MTNLTFSTFLPFCYVDTLHDTYSIAGVI